MSSSFKGNLFIVSAPSGAGKTSLLKALSERMSSFEIAISTTTRNQRPGETDGVHYYFVDRSKFESLIEADQFLEYAEVFGNYYGTSRSTVEKVLEKGVDLVLEIDWQGAQQVRAKNPDCTSIFILPPSKDELRHRLTGRGQDPMEVIDKRMDAALEEISHYSEYDYLVINDVFDEALDELQQIIESNRLTLSYQENKHAEMLAQLKRDE